jgi:hypothetical protein
MTTKEMLTMTIVNKVGKVETSKSEGNNGQTYGKTDRLVDKEDCLDGETMR